MKTSKTNEVSTKQTSTIRELFEGLQLEQLDIETLNYTVGQLVIENLKARLGSEDFTDSALTRNDLAELSNVLAKLNTLKLYLPKTV